MRKLEKRDIDGLLDKVKARPQDMSLMIFGFLLVTTIIEGIGIWGMYSYVDNVTKTGSLLGSVFTKILIASGISWLIFLNRTISYKLQTIVFLVLNILVINFSISALVTVIFIAIANKMGSGFIIISIVFMGMSFLIALFLVIRSLIRAGKGEMRKGGLGIYGGGSDKFKYILTPIVGIATIIIGVSRIVIAGGDTNIQVLIILVAGGALSLGMAYVYPIYFMSMWCTIKIPYSVIKKDDRSKEDKKEGKRKIIRVLWIKRSKLFKFYIITMLISIIISTYYHNKSQIILRTSPKIMIEDSTDLKKYVDTKQIMKFDSKNSESIGYTTTGWRSKTYYYYYVYKQNGNIIPMYSSESNNLKGIQYAYVKSGRDITSKDKDWEKLYKKQSYSEDMWSIPNYRINVINPKTFGGLDKLDSSIEDALSWYIIFGTMLMVIYSFIRANNKLEKEKALEALEKEALEREALEKEALETEAKSNEKIKIKNRKKQL